MEEERGTGGRAPPHIAAEGKDRGGGRPRRRAKVMPFRFASSSLAGKDHRGASKVNQDCVIVHPHILELPHLHLFAVMDGHGPNGDLVSHKIRERLVPELSEALTRSPSVIEEAASVSNMKEARRLLERFKGLFQTVCHALHDQVMAMEADTSRSGSTLVAALLIGSHCVVANVGDSRCVLFESGDSREDQGQSACFQPVPVTADHVPAWEKERRRIEAAGGMVGPLVDPASGEPMGPLRVWSPKYGGTAPGLAMSRSIGDGLASEVGVICDPIISYRRVVQGRDHWIVLASDGVWDALPHGEVAAELALHGADASTAVHGLCDRAEAVWRANGMQQGSAVVDDISAIALRLWPKAAPKAAAAPEAVAQRVGGPPSSAASAASINTSSEVSKIASSSGVGPTSGGSGTSGQGQWQSHATAPAPALAHQAAATDSNSPAGKPASDAPPRSGPTEAQSAAYATAAGPSSLAKDRGAAAVQAQAPANDRAWAQSCRSSPPPAPTSAQSTSRRKASFRALLQRLPKSPPADKFRRGKSASVSPQAETCVASD